MGLYGFPRRTSFNERDKLQAWLKQIGHPMGTKNIDEVGGVYTMKRDGENIVGYIYCRLTGIESQCGMVLFDKWDFTGVTDELFKEHLDSIESIANVLYYSQAMVTGVNLHHLKRLEANGFKKVNEFRNERSGNTVYVAMKTLSPQKWKTPSETTER